MRQIHQVRNGIKEPLALFSRKFSKSEACKSTYDRELLAIYYSLRHFDWLMGQQFKVFTDQKALVYGLTMKKPTPQQSRWLSYISEFNCELCHVSGSQNVVADALSRSIGAISSDFHEKLAQGQREDRELQHFLANCDSPVVEREIENSTLLCDRLFRPFVPKSMRFQIFLDIHGLSHPWPKPTLRLIKEQFTWPHINKQVTRWAKHCEICQKYKVSRHTKGPTTARFHTVHIDLVGQLPPPHGCQYLVTIIDRFSRWPEVVPVADMFTETVANAFLHAWVSRFGVPRILISDRGGQFESAVWSQLMKTLGIDRKRRTAYHPESNGAIERFHRTLKCASRPLPGYPPLV